MKQAGTYRTRFTFTMGKPSIFSFPYPGRKRPTKAKGVVGSSPVPAINISKAQRILGAEGDLNIDSPVRENGGSRRGFRLSSSGMSIAASVSSEADESACVSNDNISWAEESGVFPRRDLFGIASSTALRRQNYEEPTMDTSSLERQLRAKSSSSTLASYYDRQKAPLSVSQQTSASSIRDLALRKGLPPVTTFHESPLIEEECPNDEGLYGAAAHTTQPSASPFSKKKPSRLDMSRLFPKQRKDTASPATNTKYSSSMTPPTSSGAHDTGCGVRRKLESIGERHTNKTIQREDQAKCLRSNAKRPPEIPSRRKNTHYRQAANSTAQYAYAEWHTQRNSSSEAQPSREGHLKRSGAQEIYAHGPKNALYEAKHLDSNRARLPESRHSPSWDQYVSWENRNAGSGLLLPHWETGSFTSLSSHNTKCSRRTSPSVFSNSDLNNNSVLSISSDEDTDETRHEGPCFTGQQTFITIDQVHISPHGSKKPRDRSLKVPAPNVDASTRISRTQDGNFLTIPPPSPAGSRISGPWNSSTPDRKQSTASNWRDSSMDVESRRSSPPLSTSSSSQSRIMAVTKEEEALIEALRQKRARMKSTVIAKHETRKSPSRAPLHKIRDSESSILTAKPEKTNSKQRILLFLDQPISDGRQIETAEPSPDLSDFLSFGSDEETGSTPRTSWLVAREQGRPDSITHLEEQSYPIAPKIAARLSAVGALAGGHRQAQNVSSGVTFLDNVKGNTEDFLDDDNTIWDL